MHVVLWALMHAVLWALTVRIAVVGRFVERAGTEGGLAVHVHVHVLLVWLRYSAVQSLYIDGIAVSVCVTPASVMLSPGSTTRAVVLVQGDACNPSRIPACVYRPTAASLCNAPCEEQMKLHRHGSTRAQVA